MAHFLVGKMEFDGSVYMIILKISMSSSIFDVE